MFWRMHRWLWPNQHRFSEENFKKVARGMGMDPEVFADALYSDQVEAALQEDVQAVLELNLRSVPTLYVNGKHLARWKVGEDEKLTLLLDELLGPAPESGSR
jgi:predicted DsbA family dithiol-disulfide isomerase